MKPTTTTHPDPVQVVKTLDADALRARIDELDAETSALRVLLRSARARDNARRRGGRQCAEPATE